MGQRHQLKRRAAPAQATALALALASSALLLAACHRADDQTNRVVVATEAGAPTVAVPADRLAPDELVEGNEKGFALHLPRGFHVSIRFAGTIDARGVAQQPAVTAFIQARVTGGKLLRGAHASDFKGVIVPAEPTRPLDIHVEQDRSDTYTVLEIVDATPVAPVNVPAAEAYKANGMTPDGKLADPQHML